MPNHTTSETHTLSKSFLEARADQLVETTWAMIKAMFIGTLAFVVCEIVLGKTHDMFVIGLFLQAGVGAWVLYQTRCYIIARYYAFLGASVGALFLITAFGTESYAYFILAPLVLGGFTSFESKKERFGLSAVILILALLVVEYRSLITFVEPMSSPEDYQPVFILVTMILSYHMIGSFLEVNRDFMVRSKGMTALLQKQEKDLEEECYKEEIQTSQFQATNRKLEEEMNQRVLMERKLSSSNEQLSQFSFAASHDLKEPLRSISSFIRILQKKVVGMNDNILEQRTNEVIESASRMTTLLDDLLMFSRAGRHNNTSTQVDLNQVVTSCLHNVESELAKIEASVEVSPLPVVMADKKALGILFSQVIDNSICFSAKNRKLELQISAKELDNGMVEVFVKDNGIGIGADCRERAFKPFFEVKSEICSTGSGVGLAISRKIVHSFGGEVKFISNDNDIGITLAFTLPVLS